MTTHKKLYLKNREVNCDKFWTISEPEPQSDGTFGVEVCYGRTGTYGQRKMRSFYTLSVAWAWIENQVRAKQRHGYTDKRWDINDRLPVQPQPKPQMQSGDDAVLTDRKIILGGD
jgi:predicted DNA-binding WGR domain protein